METVYVRLSSGDPSVLSTATPGDFTVQLGQNIECVGECQAYLLEATIPFTWHNVHADDCLVIADSGKEHHLTLTPAYYESVSSLLSEMNKAKRSSRGQSRSRRIPLQGA